MAMKEDKQDKQINSRVLIERLTEENNMFHSFARTRTSGQFNDASLPIRQ